MPIYDGLQPASVWTHFAALNRIPRVSKNEAAARDYIIAQAELAGAKWDQDAFGNVVVTVASSSGEDVPAVAVQSHLDMVPALATDARHDWKNDPIIPRIVDGRVYATGTTLGADNGIGVAMALAVLSSADIVHGPLQMIFTTEEEIGLRGATELDATLVSARYLVNLDSEDIDKLTIGCTGGATIQIELPERRIATRADQVAYRISIHDAQGGHSGIEIDKRRANPIKLLGGFLSHLPAGTFQISTLEGGSAGNAIPKSASAVIVLSPNQAVRLPSLVADLEERTLKPWRDAEPDIIASLSLTSLPSDALDESESSRVVGLIGDLPHGVQQWSEAYTGKPETSANLAMVRTSASGVTLVVSIRSFLANSLAALQATVREIAEAQGAKVELGSTYPGWEPVASSKLLTIAMEAFEETYGLEPEIEVVHAGLECGAIISKIPGMEAVSFGPNIGGAHTPDENVTISTVESTWQLLLALLERLAAVRA